MPIAVDSCIVALELLRPHAVRASAAKRAKERTDARDRERSPRQGRLGAREDASVGTRWTERARGAPPGFPFWGRIGAGINPTGGSRNAQAPPRPGPDQRHRGR